MEVKHIIDPERHGLWIAASFILALLALVVAFASMQRTNIVLVGTQAEVVALNNKIEALKAEKAAPAVAPTAAAAPAAAPAEPVSK